MAANSAKDTGASPPPTAISPSCLAVGTFVIECSNGVSGVPFC